MDTWIVFSVNNELACPYIFVHVGKYVMGLIYIFLN